MLRLDAAAFYFATSALRYMHAYVKTCQELGGDSALKAPLTAHHREGILHHSKDLTAHVDTLQVVMTGMSLDRLIEDAQKPEFSYERLAEAIEDVDARLKDELRLITVYVLDYSKAKYFETGQDLFGADVAQKFQSAAFEIDEAGKCLAVHRSTACVFHLMRVLEIGIRALARCLAIPDPTKPSERIKDGIESRWPSTANRIQGDGALFESLYASLDAVKNPWRNATMHVEKKYTGEEAINVMNAVEGFMKRLALRMDEMGQPLA